MMQKPLRILIDKNAVNLNKFPFGELCLGLGCQHVTVSVLLCRLKHNGPVVWGVAVCVGIGMSFCTVPISGQDFRVTIKLSRWLSPDKWYGVVKS
jgi:hypothetical protein